MERPFPCLHSPNPGTGPLATKHPTTSLSCFSWLYPGTTGKTLREKKHIETQPANGTLSCCPGSVAQKIGSDTEVFDEVKSISSPLFQRLKPSSVFKKGRALKCRGYRRTWASAVHRIPGGRCCRKFWNLCSSDPIRGEKPLPADL